MRERFWQVDSAGPKEWKLCTKAAQPFHLANCNRSQTKPGEFDNYTSWGQLGRDTVYVRRRTVDQVVVYKPCLYTVLDDVRGMGKTTPFVPHRQADIGPTINDVMIA